jgi:predicted dithiol-disulfide oxidoreductase (DUF899 family)
MIKQFPTPQIVSRQEWDAARAQLLANAAGIAENN